MENLRYKIQKPVSITESRQWGLLFLFDGSSGTLRPVEQQPASHGAHLHRPYVRYFYSPICFNSPCWLLRNQDGRIHVGDQEEIRSPITCGSVQLDSPTALHLEVYLCFMLWHAEQYRGSCGGKDQTEWHADAVKSFFFFFPIDCLEEDLLFMEFIYVTGSLAVSEDQILLESPETH